MKKLIILLIIILAFINVNCFGRFAIIRKLYIFIDDIKLTGSSPILVKFIKSVIAWVFFLFPFPFVGGIALLVDFLIFNVIEFWTGENLIEGKKDASKAMDMQNEDKPIHSKGIKPGKSIAFLSAENGMKVILFKSVDGTELRIKSNFNGETREVVAFQGEPGRLYKVNGDSLEPIEISLDENGLFDKVIFGSEQIIVDRF